MTKKRDGIHRFLRIPHDVLVPILSEFLELRAISRLDQAFCVHYHRRDLLKLLRCDELVLHRQRCSLVLEEYNQRYVSFMRWAIGRNTKVDFLYIKKELNVPAHLAAFVPISNAVFGGWVLEHWSKFESSALGCVRFKQTTLLCMHCTRQMLIALRE